MGPELVPMLQCVEKHGYKEHGYKESTAIRNCLEIPIPMHLYRKEYGYKELVQHIHMLIQTATTQLTIDHFLTPKRLICICLYLCNACF